VYNKKRREPQHWPTTFGLSLYSNVQSQGTVILCRATNMAPSLELQQIVEQLQRMGNHFLFNNSRSITYAAAPVNQAKEGV